MPGQGIQHLPLSRIPQEWDAKWFADFCRDVLALADIRNAIGEGVLITGQPNEPGTITVDADLQDLLLQSFVVAQPSGFLEFERTLAGESGVVQIIDGGPDSNISVELVDYGVPLGKLRQLSSMGVLANPVDGAGAIQNVQAEVDKAVLHRSGTDMLFDVIDSTYITDFTEAAQDAVGAILNDSPSIDLTYNDALGVITADIVVEYVQDLVGAMLADSASVDFTYNDALGTISAGVDVSWAPTWTGAHTHNARVIMGVDGSVGSPQLGWTDAGFYRVGANTLGISTNGVLRAALGTAALATSVLFRGPDGSATDPTYSFVNGTGNGMYLSGTNTVSWATNGVLAMSLNASRQLLMASDGSAASPGMGWSDVGIFRNGANILGLAAGGAEVLRVRNDSIRCVQIVGALGISFVTTPAQITANQNDYSPTNVDLSGVLRLSSDASRNITGIQTPNIIGRLLILSNVGTQNIVLTNEDAASTAAYRFAIGANITIGANKSVTLQYDATSSRWRAIGVYL